MLLKCDAFWLDDAAVAVALTGGGFCWPWPSGVNGGVCEDYGSACEGIWHGACEETPSDVCVVFSIDDPEIETLGSGDGTVQGR